MYYFCEHTTLLSLICFKFVSVQYCEYNAYTILLSNVGFTQGSPITQFHHTISLVTGTLVIDLHRDEHLSIYNNVTQLLLYATPHSIILDQSLVTVMYMTHSKPYVWLGYVYM